MAANPSNADVKRRDNCFAPPQPSFFIDFSRMPRRSFMLCKALSRSARGVLPTHFMCVQVIARQRYGIEPLRELDLEYCHILVAEACLAARKIELPHPAKAF